MTSLDFRAEAHGFYLQDKPFVPLIKDRGSSFAKEEGYNSAVVTLPASASSDLDWSFQINEARELVAKGALLVWEFDFGLSQEKISLTDPALFLSYTLALDQFTKIIWPEFSAVTLSAIFYRGDSQFLSRFIWSQEQEKNLSLWLENFFPNEIDVDAFLHNSANRNILQVYCIFVLSEYLHRLLSFLPDTLQVFCLFDVASDLSLSEAALLFSKERFSHFHLGVCKSPIPIMGLCYNRGECFSGFLGEGKLDASYQKEIHFAVCLPTDESLFSKGLENLEKVLSVLKENEIPYRIIPEALLTQEWAELEGIICMTDFLTSSGKRSLQGFCAAGGTVISYGKEGNFFEEITFEDFVEKNRSRGIRTPDLLLPKQPR